MENFIISIKDIDISGLAEYLKLGKEDSDTLDTNTSKATIDYELEFEMRSWGIKSSYIIIKEVRLSVLWSTEGSEEKEIEINSNDGKWQVEHELTFHEDGTLCPSSIEVDFNKMIITVN